MKSADWFILFVIFFGIGIILFLASIMAILFERSGGFLRDFGLVGFLVSTFMFLSAYVAFQRYKQESKIET